MPKIIENLHQRLLDEAIKQIRENGYESMTIRSVAKAVGVGIGTIYNYFPSKEDLVATFMLEGWMKAMDRIEQVKERETELEPVLKTIYGEIRYFLQTYSAVVSNEDAKVTFTKSTQGYHIILRNQLSEKIRKFTKDDFTSSFIAEAILTWTVEGKDYNTLSAVLLRLI